MVMLDAVSCPSSHWRNRPHPPAPEPLERSPGPLKFLRMLRNGPIEILTRDHYELPIVITKTILGPVAYVNGPDALRHVLIDNDSNYGRAALQREIFATTLGMGLLTAEGRRWRLQRRLIGPVFTPKMVAGFANAMGEGARCLVERWRTYPDKSRIDIALELPARRFRSWKERCSATDLVAIEIICTAHWSTCLIPPDALIRLTRFVPRAGSRA